MNRIYTQNLTTLEESSNFFCETLFHNGNGYIGVRGSLSEGVPNGWDTMRGTYINGFYDIIPMKQAENLCNFVNEKETIISVTDTQTVRLFVEGMALDMTKGRIIEHTRSLDMEKGITTRKLVWESYEGKCIELDETRMTSFDMLSLFTIEYKVTALNFDGEISIESIHNPHAINYCNPKDPRTAAESFKNLEVLEFGFVDEHSIAVSETVKSHLTMCSIVSHNVNSDADVTHVCAIDGNEAVYSVKGFISKGQSISIEKYSILTDSLREKDVKQVALEKLGAAMSNGLEYYYASQKKYLDDFWHRCEMEIEGDDVLNMAVSFNMYELLQSAPKDEYCSVAAKGLSGEGYEGHYFWDAETFVLPFFTLTNPCIAKNVLDYRYASLDKARKNALMMGHKSGALFPWRTITGTECSGYFVSGGAAYHIDADIAYAVVAYYLTSGDRVFIEEKGEEILLETARLWLDVGCYNREGDFVINEVTGPDEYTCLIDNNYYTNCAAKFNMKWAVKLYRELEREGKVSILNAKLKVTQEELEAIDKAADAMLLLYDEKLGINPQDDSFLSKPIWDIANTPKEDFPLLLHYHPLHLYRYQVCKQADTILAYYMFDKDQSPEVVERSFRYYEKITTHDSSLSTCVFSIIASKLGLTDEAYTYFGDSAKMDLENSHDNTMYGIHTANMGGCYMAIVNGFAGVDISESGISAAPFIPKTWKKLKFSIMYRECLIKFEVGNEDMTVSLIEGQHLDITLYGVKQTIEAGKEYTCKTKVK